MPLRYTINESNLSIYSLIEYEHAIQKEKVSGIFKIKFFSLQ